MKIKDYANYVIALDFDGTVVTHDYPRIGKPLPNCIPTLRKLIDAGAKICLNTMRSGSELEEAVNYLLENNIPLYGINSNPNQSDWTSSPKVYAHIYIDDAALGCPLLNEIEFSNRPFVDWTAVDKLLFPIEQNIGIQSAATVKNLSRASEQFEYTTEGYNRAMEYLKSVGQWERANAGFSTDGWSTIQYANIAYARLENNQ